MTKVALVVLDGLGIRKETEYNAVSNANMPYFKSLLKTYPNILLKTYGKYVGLDDNQFGNSEVGHLNLGAGRIVKQNSTKINDDIKSGEFYNNSVLIKFLDKLKQSKKNLHLFGLCSTGGVHSELDHLYKLLKLCKLQKFKNVFIHFITDGRDTNIHSGKVFYKKLEKQIEEIGVGKIVSVCGRFYAMDREKNYDRTKMFLQVLNNYEADNKFEKLDQVFNYFYNKNITDEFIEPSILKVGNFKANVDDGILCFNFRSDRVRQIFELLIETGFKNLCSFIEYDKAFKKNVTVAFREDSNKNCLSEVLAKNNKTQLRISETTKYAHVTYFFNLLKEEPFKGEKRIIIEGDKVDNFAQKPKMKAKEITNKVIAETNNQQYDFILVNFPNADMLGHTGDYNKTIKSLEFLDKNLKKLCNNLLKKNYTILITADHGNADTMKNKNGSPCTTHTKSDAPFIVVSKNVYNLQKTGKLANVSPTVLRLLNIKPPKEFSETSLIK